MRNSFFSPKQTMTVSQKEQTLQRKEHSRQNSIEWVADTEPSKSTTSVKEFTKIDGNATSYAMNRIEANTRIRVQQDVDLVLRNLKLKILSQPCNEVLLTTDKRQNHYKTNEDSITLKEGLLFREY